MSFINMEIAFVIEIPLLEININYQDMEDVTFEWSFVCYLCISNGCVCGTSMCVRLCPIMLAFIKLLQVEMDSRGRQ